VKPTLLEPEIQHGTLDALALMRKKSANLHQGASWA